MGMYGADVTALRSLGRSLRRRQQEIDATSRRLASIVETLPWSGRDHDRFVSQWRSVHAPALANVASELGVASGQAYHHARRQEQASRRR